MINKLKVIYNKKQRFYLIVLFVGLTISAVLEMIGVGAIPVFVNLLLDPEKLASYLPQSDLTDFFISKNYLNQILFVSLFLLVIFLFKNFFLFCTIYLQARIFRNIKVENSRRLFQAYVNSPYYLHLSRNPAVLANNVTTEVSLSTRHLESLLLLTREFLVLIAVFVLLVFVDPATVLIVFAVVSFIVTLYHLFLKKKLTTLSKLAQVHRGRQLQIVNQVFGAIKDTKILGREMYFTNEFKNNTAQVERYVVFSNIVSKLPRLFLEILGMIIILVVTILFVVNDRPIELIIPTLALLGAATIKLLPSFNTITSQLASMRGTLVSFDLVINELNKLKRYLSKNDNYKNNNSRENKILNSKVELKNITFKYPDTEKEVLKKLNLEIKAGSSIGIIGITGSGKSTLVDIILGLLTPSSGEVIVDGDNISIGNNLSAWQKQIGYIPQDIYLIDDTIKKNIAFGIPDHEIKEKDVDRAIELAQLSDFVSGLPLQNNTIIGNRGIRLSGGQRQRIGIARALYRKSKILVFDEATSSLDIKTEKAIVDSIEKLDDKITLIVITHRLQTLKNFKNIYFIKEGLIANHGTYEEIIENKNIYKN
jgi:ATP-binding cassette, subfamily B, bacterial PglK